MALNLCVVCRMSRVRASENDTPSLASSLFWDENEMRRADLRGKKNDDKLKRMNDDHVR